MENEFKSVALGVGIVTVLCSIIVAITVSNLSLATKLANSDKPLELACAYNGNTYKVIQSCLTLQMTKE